MTLAIVEISPYLRRPARSYPVVLAARAGLNARFQNGDAVKVPVGDAGEYWHRGRVVCALKRDLLIDFDGTKAWLPARMLHRVAPAEGGGT